jgi:hypothetical protein
MYACMYSVTFIRFSLFNRLLNQRCLNSEILLVLKHVSCRLFLALEFQRLKGLSSRSFIARSLCYKAVRRTWFVIPISITTTAASQVSGSETFFYVNALIYV